MPLWSTKGGKAVQEHCFKERYVAEQYHRVMNLFSMLWLVLSYILCSLGGGCNSIREGKNKNGKQAHEMEIPTGDAEIFTV